VLECQPEDLALRDAWFHRAEQSQPCIHTMNFTVLASLDAGLRRNHTFASALPYLAFNTL